MLFNSYVFVLLFLPITVLVYYILNRVQGKGNTVSKIGLLCASLYFYGYFNWDYLVIIVSSILLNYLFSSFILNVAKSWEKKALLTLGLVLNIGCLFYYKYFDFFITNFNRAFKSSFDLLNVALPLGISFFTFQQVSYLIDSYKGNVPHYSLLDYSLFVTFFPQLVAGPIVLHSELIPQLTDAENRSFNDLNFGKGLFSFTIGLAKKVLLADSFGEIADWGFGTIGTLGTVNAVIVMLSYTLQIYLDFSGYSDMAIGLGLMFNFKLPDNFDSPYRAVTLTDFWKRWHMTLTRFFTSYVYIPLGGSRKGKARTMINIMIIFLISGIWHGANWTFIAWGCLHGIGQVFCRFFNIKPSKNKIGNCMLWLCTFLFISLAWVIFRADSLHAALLFFRQLISFKGFTIYPTIVQAFQFPELAFILQYLPGIGSVLLQWSTAFFTAASLAGILLLRNTSYYVSRLTQPRWYHCVFCSLLLIMSITSFSGVSSFLYWNF